MQPLQPLQALLTEAQPTRYTGEKYAFGSGGLLTTCVTTHAEVCSMRILQPQATHWTPNPQHTYVWQALPYFVHACSSRVEFTNLHLVLLSLKSKQNWDKAKLTRPVKAMSLHTRELEIYKGEEKVKRKKSPSFHDYFHSWVMKSSSCCVVSHMTLELLFCSDLCLKRSLKP